MDKNSLCFLTNSTKNAFNFHPLECIHVEVTQFFIQMQYLNSEMLGELK